MNIQNLIQTLGLSVLLSCPSLTLASEPIRTDWLQATTGSSGETLAASVLKVTRQDETIVVDVNIPNLDLERYETVVVVGKKSGKVITPVKKPELLIEDGEAYGYRIQIKRVPGFEFRLQLKDSSYE